MNSTFGKPSYLNFGSKQLHFRLVQTYLSHLWNKDGPVVSVDPLYNILIGMEPRVLPKLPARLTRYPPLKSSSRSAP